MTKEMHNIGDSSDIIILSTVLLKLAVVEETHPLLSKFTNINNSILAAMKREMKESLSQQD